MSYFFIRLLVSLLRKVELELTESTVAVDIEQTLDIMRQLKDMGFIFSIDDFGTGYFSLAYLKQIPDDYILFYLKSYNLGCGIS